MRACDACDEMFVYVPKTVQYSKIMFPVYQSKFPKNASKQKKDHDEMLDETREISIQMKVRNELNLERSPLSDTTLCLPS